MLSELMLPEVMVSGPIITEQLLPELMVSELRSAEPRFLDR
jgi:hypothetical protein